MARATKKTPKHIINGDDSDNILSGNNANGGKNTINGRDGNDTLTGGKSADRLTGGTGADTFVYTQAGDSAASKKGAFAAATGDTITDFDVGVDKIDLTGLNLAFNGSAAKNGGVWLGADARGNTIVYADTDKDGTADLAIRLTGQKALTAADFKGLATTTPTLGLTLDKVATDNLLNKAEAGGQVSVTGAVTGDFKAGDVVTLKIGSKDVTGAVGADGKFAIAVAGSDLAAATRIDASFSASNITGGTATATASQAYVVDVTPPAVPVVTTTFGTQETDTTPTISGTAEAGSTVILSFAKTGGATFTKEVAVGADGTWTTTLAAGEALGFGDFTLTAKARDAAGNESAASTADTFTLLDLPSNLTATLRSDDQQSGGIIIDNNGAFSNNTPVLSGSGVEAGHELQLKIIGPAADKDYGGSNGKTFNVTVNANGTWSFDLGASGQSPFSADGEYKIFLIHREIETGKVNPGSGTAVATFQHRPGTEDVDTLTGTAFLDHLAGGAGEDTLNGFAGNDTLDGGEGDDTLDGGTGADTMSGGSGGDTYFVDNVNDEVIEKVLEGVDTVISKVNFTLANNVDILILVDGAGSINGTGNGLNNQIIGNEANNNLFGLDGSDYLDGGAGQDVMQGGKGDDIYKVDNAGDVASENAGEGNDTVTSTLQSTTLGVNLENLQLYGTAENGTGNELNNVISGNGLANVLQGKGGNDRLDGGFDADIMQGGTGDDTYVIDNANDVVTENADEGYDTVETSINYILGAHVEKLVLIIGQGNINGTGNGLDNQIIGNNGNNVLKGDIGDDVLTGGIGDDTLNGGDDYDTAAYDDAVEENGKGVTVNLNDAEAQDVGGGLGFDTLIGIEGLFGSQFDDTFTGNNEDNTLEGADGDDTLNGGADDDWLDGGNGNDELDGGDQDDDVSGGAGNDTLNGGNGEDWLAGGEGDDTLDGGEDNDTAAYDDAFEENGKGVTVSLAAAGAQIVGGGQGEDTLIGIENLYGSAFDDKLTGDGENNRLEGDAGNDELNGGDGNDWLDGGAGNDILKGGDSGWDIASYQNAQAGVEVSLALLGQQQDTKGAGRDTLNDIDMLVGSAFADKLTGGSADDVLVGGGGNDSLDGGDGLGDKADYWDAQSVDGVTGVTVDLSITGFQVIGAGLGSDKLTNIENLYGSDYKDTLKGNVGDNVLDGGQGVDRMEGRKGDDGYLVDNVGDQIVELAGEGYDWVVTSVSYTLAAGQEIEDLELADGAGNINTTGNELDNRLVSNDGNNSLDGGEGFDIASFKRAGAGVKVTLVNAEFGQNTGQGFDTLNNIEGLEGSGYADNLTGDENANYLSGRNGADTLTGGAGADNFNFRYDVNGIDAADTITDFSQADQDKIQLTSFADSGAWNASATLASLLAAGYLLFVKDADAEWSIHVDIDGGGDNFQKVFMLQDWNGALSASDFILF